MVDVVSVISNDENHRVWDVLKSNRRNPNVQVGELFKKQLIFRDWIEKIEVSIWVILSYPLVGIEKINHF